MRDEERAAEGRDGEDDAEGVPTGFGVNAGIVEEIRQRWELDPESVHPSWSEVFEEEPPPAALPAEAEQRPPPAGARASPPVGEN
jgi:2-oxoglutarate dehydrogenase complex dehydrogenase (E1) component-like enzyme